MFIVLDKTSSRPLYEQIAAAIRAKILSGELPPGEPLPSIRQLAADLLTSVITTKRAYQELEAEGLIHARPGLGSFVSEMSSSARQNLRLEEIETRLRQVLEYAARIDVDSQTVLELLEALIAEGDETRHA